MLSVKNNSSSSGASLRLLILAAGDPTSELAFSGSLRSLCNALERRGIVHHKGNVNGFFDPRRKPTFSSEMLQKFDRRLKLMERYRWSRPCFWANSRRARRIARAHPGFNACLLYGTTFNPALSVPAYCALDATVAQVIRAKLWAFRRMSKGRQQFQFDYQKDLLKTCAGVFPRTQWAANSLVEDYGLAGEKLCVTNAGPNYEIEPLPHGPYDAQTILVVGRRFEIKGGPLIVDAFRIARRALPKAKLVIVGCTPPLDEPGIEVVGPISKDSPGGLGRMLEYYRQASLFCLMSPYEAFGVAVVEAQNCFVPCVVPKRCAFTETVVDGVTGRHVAKDDPELLARVFVEMLSAPEKLAEMGAAAHVHVKENYTWDVAARRVHEQIEGDLTQGSFNANHPKEAE